MRFSVSTLLSLALPLAAWANPHGSTHHARHAELARRHAADVELHRRFNFARWTFYDVGLGACGAHNIETDFIVALNSAQFGQGYPGPNCFKKIVMHFNGKTAEATITDECPGCPPEGLDLSRGLFRFFAPESAGVLSGTWYFAGEGGAPPPPPPPPPKTTWTPPIASVHIDPPTVKPEPTKTSESSSTSSTTSTSASSGSESRAASTATSASSNAHPAPSLAPETPQILGRLNQIIVNLGGITCAGASH